MNEDEILPAFIHGFRSGPGTTGYKADAQSLPAIATVDGRRSRTIPPISTAARGTPPGPAKPRVSIALLAINSSNWSHVSEGNLTHHRVPVPGRRKNSAEPHSTGLEFRPIAALTVRAIHWVFRIFVSATIDHKIFCVTHLATAHGFSNPIANKHVRSVIHPQTPRRARGARVYTRAPPSIYRRRPRGDFTRASWSPRNRPGSATSRKSPTQKQKIARRRGSEKAERG